MKKLDFKNLAANGVVQIVVALLIGGAVYHHYRHNNSLGKGTTA